jgi:purine nucleosidase
MRTGIDVRRRLKDKAMPRKIIIDTDPGQDDAVAILMALASPEELDVIGIVAVAGNVGLHHNANNARKVVELSGPQGYPSMPAAPGPCAAHLVTAEHVHGETGLNGPDLPEPTIPLQAQHGVDYIIDTLMAPNPARSHSARLGR